MPCLPRVAMPWAFTVDCTGTTRAVVVEEVTADCVGATSIGVEGGISGTGTTGGGAARGEAGVTWTTGGDVVAARELGSPSATVGEAGADLGGAGGVGATTVGEGGAADVDGAGADPGGGPAGSEGDEHGRRASTLGGTSRKEYVEEGGQDVLANGKDASSNTTWREMMRRFVVRSRHL